MSGGLVQAIIKYYYCGPLSPDSMSKEQLQGHLLSFIEQKNTFACVFEICDPEQSRSQQGNT